MRNTFDEEVEDHKPEDCYPCGGSKFYKLPLGAPDDGREVEDEDNCYCDCHGYGPERGWAIPLARSSRAAAERIGRA